MRILLTPNAHEFLFSFAAALIVAAAASAAVAHAAPAGDFTMAQALHYPYVEAPVAAENADIIAWVRNLDGARNIWIARGPLYKPVQLTGYAADDGQELTQLAFTPDAERVVFVRGGDHDANWPAEGTAAPNPAASPDQPQTLILSASLAGGAPVKIADGDAPAISAQGVLAYLKGDQVWTTSLDGQGKPERLFFDRGKDSDLQWSGDGSRLAFVSDRGDHAFIGIFAGKDRPLVYVSPSTSRDGTPRWSLDGLQLAFVRRPGKAGRPEPILQPAPKAWSIWTADPAKQFAHAVWQSPDTLAGSYPDIERESNLQWAAGNRLVFLAYLDDWPHLYCVSASGGTPLLLTPGPFMVEHVSASHDHRFIIYDANTGTRAGDGDRRHVFEVAVDRASPVQITSGDSLEWSPVGTAGGAIAFVSAGAQKPPSIGVVAGKGVRPAIAESQEPPPDFPWRRFLTPKAVSFHAADGTLVHGQLFQAARGEAAGSAALPGIVFVHGGPPRQMLLGWHYMSYYSNAYALNQYLAAHGFAVLSVNYRLGIGYGRAFHQPERAGPLGAAEYQDILAGARFLQSLPGVDARRIGIWGGSYGGFLTALALARNSDIFKAGVDLHGVHDWSRLADELYGKIETRYEKSEREPAMRIAWESSPDASIEGWKSPVLLIQGDDDRNVPFQQTVDLARRLGERRVPFEEIVIPNEIHGFLLHASWLRVDTATADFFARMLANQPP